MTAKEPKEFNFPINCFQPDFVVAFYRMAEENGLVLQKIPNRPFERGTTELSLKKHGELVYGLSGPMLLASNQYGIKKVYIGSQYIQFMCTEYPKLQEQLQELVLKVTSQATHKPVFRGSALALDLDNVGFFETSNFKPIFSESLERKMQYSLYAPLDFVKQIGPRKRGIMLSGPYGTGKSSVAAYMAHKAVSQGLTFLYLRSARLLETAGELIPKLGHCVVFVEDIDKLFDGHRDSSVDLILNSLDGVDNKQDPTMYIFTTNDLQVIERALLRPGRIDSLIEMELPNAVATKAILSTYLGDKAGQDTINTVTQYLLNRPVGITPAVMREAVTRAELMALMDGETGVSEKLLIEAIDSLVTHVQLVNSPRPITAPTLDSVMTKLINGGYS